MMAQRLERRSRGARMLVPVVAAVVALTTPAAARAQEPVRSFDQLDTRLKPGDAVRVTTARGGEIAGRIRKLEPSALTLDASGPVTLEADAVRLITGHKGRPIGKGALWGLVAGATFGVVAVAADPCTDCGDEGAWMLVGAGLFGAIGAGVGAAVGALVPGKTQVVYRAPAPAGAAGSRLSLAPIITPRAKGVAVSVSF